MNRELLTLHMAEIIDDKALSLSDICRGCHVSADQILDLVEYGVVAPIERQSSNLYFSGASMYRVQCALRLKQDLGVNLAGAALALELLDEIKMLRARLRRMET